MVVLGHSPVSDRLTRAISKAAGERPVDRGEGCDERYGGARRAQLVLCRREKKAGGRRWRRPCMGFLCLLLVNLTAFAAPNEVVITFVP